MFCLETYNEALQASMNFEFLGTQEESNAEDQSRPRRSLSIRLLLCFDLYSNLKKILSTSSF